MLWTKDHTLFYRDYKTSRKAKFIRIETPDNPKPTFRSIAAAGC
jgi:hypothetical protein